MTIFIVDMLVRVTFAACGGGFDHYPLNRTKCSVLVVVKRIGGCLGGITGTSAQQQKMFAGVSLVVDFSECTQKAVEIIVIENVRAFQNAFIGVGNIPRLFPC